MAESEVDARWTLEELNVLAVATLTQDKADDGRWQGVELGLRTIRYYVTLGLVDRPAAMRGRKAYYGLRHLLQLVAVKRLQGQGLSLDVVQARLRDLTSEELSEIARVPNEIIDEKPGTKLEPGGFEEAWALAVEEAMRPPESGPQIFSIALDPAVTVCIATRHALEPSDVYAVKQAAQRMLETLWERGLITAPRIQEAG